METKTYVMEHLGCANCAAKMEARFNALPQVEAASITFATRLLRLTARDPDALLPELEAIARSIEDPVRIRPRMAARSHPAHGHGEHCGCGHDHQEHCGCGHAHHEHEHDHHEHDHHEHAHHDHGHDHHPQGSPGLLLAGAALFAAGLVLQALGARYAAAAAFLAGYGLLGWPVLRTAGQNLIRGHVFDENLLMSLATLGAILIGEFPEALGVMLFYRVGEYFEERAVARSRSQIMEAVDLRPERVQLVTGAGVQTLPADEARVGDTVLVRPGDRIPLDGIVLSGESRIDTAPITGEPVPLGVGPGDRVTSGCINTSGQLTIRVEKPLSESMVSRILAAVESAAASKPKLDRFITRFARIYTPAVVLIAAVTAVVPSLITGGWDYWVYTALSFLVMSCPCALVLSVPLAFFSGIGAGSRRGILFKGGASMEAMGKIRAVVMDKTGTLTKGEFRVQQVSGGAAVLALAAACEANSTHPIAGSILSAAREQGLPLARPDSAEELPGLGIRAVVGGERVLCGSAKLLAQAGLTAPEARGTVVYVAKGGSVLGFIRIDDTLKEDAAAAVARLQRRGCATAILTGDAEAPARAVAEQVGIGQVYARLLPQEKLERLQALRQEHGAVMFVGDGINDAPVLAGADVGAAMGSGADAAIEAADAVFLTGRVEAIADALDLADRTTRIAWQNVIFALGVKLAVMLLGLAGSASMWLAVFADSGVAMLCVLNSIRLLYNANSR